MAEGGAEEEAKAYETVTEKMCELCLEENSFKKASWFCKQCNHRLCDKCRKYHSKVPTLKSHKIIRADEMSPISSSEHTEGQLSDEYRPPLCPTHNQPLEFYCKYHNVPVCDSCKLVDHRKCTHLQDLHQVVTEHKGKFQDVVQHLRVIDTGMCEIRKAMVKEKDMMESNKTAAIQKIKQEIKRIEILGQQKILEVEEVFKEESKDLDRETEVLKQSQKLVSKSIDELEKAGSKEDVFVFVATRHAEIQAAKYQDILNESSFLTHKEIQFEVNSKMETIDSFGNITLKKSTVSVENKPQVIDYLNIDCKTPILWFDMFPNDQCALLTHVYDSGISELRLYSASKDLLSQLDLPSADSPVKINNHQIIVAIFSERHLMVVNTDNNKLEQQSKVPISGSPWLISEYSNQNVLILVRHDSGTFCFQLLDQGGCVLKQSAVLTGLKAPNYMRTSPDRQTIYTTDQDNGIFGFNLQGDMLHHFTHKPDETNLYFGLSVQTNDSLYFTAKTKQGEYTLIKMFPIRKEVYKPLSISPIVHKIGPCYPLKCADGKLYLGKKNVKNMQFNLVYLFI